MSINPVASSMSRSSVAGGNGNNPTIKLLETKLTDLKKELEEVKKDDTLDAKVKKQKIQQLQAQIQLIELQIRQAQEAEKRKQTKKSEEEGTAPTTKPSAAPQHAIDIVM